VVGSTNGSRGEILEERKPETIRDDDDDDDGNNNMYLQLQAVKKKKTDSTRIRSYDLLLRVQHYSP
jgi:hypothetical protein